MYQALYRKYRPNKFSQIIGQDHIVNTLKNELLNGRVAHAYLFTGTRGTGKTSCAKLFSKAVNCLKSEGAEPCNKCSVCKGIDSGAILDVIEIDAASNNGVDNIREIRDEVLYTPAVTKKKVYIIDEVHMLSTGAFNALLKTLEEPPSHVIFILATTEAHKIAPTILSRCQRFDFKRILSRDILAALKTICKSENIDADKDALLIISRIADGSMRDALSILDRCVMSGEKLSKDNINDIIGICSDEYLFDFIKHIHNQDIIMALSLLDDVYYQGKDVSVLCDQLLMLWRDIMVYKSGKDAKSLIFEGQSNVDGIENIYKDLSYAEIINSIDILSDTINKLARGSNKKIMYEVCLFKLCKKDVGDDDKQSLGAEKIKTACGKKDEQPKIKKDAMQKESLLTKDNAKADEPYKNAQKFDDWGKVLSVIKNLDISLWAQLKMTEGSLDGKLFKITCTDEFTSMWIAENKDLIQNALKDIAGHGVKVEVLVDKDAPVKIIEDKIEKKRENKSDNQEENINDFINSLPEYENIKIIE